MNNRQKILSVWFVSLISIFMVVLSLSYLAEIVHHQKLKTQLEANVQALENYVPDEGILIWANLEPSIIDGMKLDNSTHSMMSAADNILSEKECLAQAVYYESRSEKRSGQVAVAEVIMNRVKNRHFPNTICGVVFEGSHRSTGCQFTFTCDGSMTTSPSGKSWDRSMDVAEQVMSGAYEPITRWATHYHTVEVSPKWSGTMRMTRQVGSHLFYRFAPRNYQASEAMVLVAPPI